MRWTCLVLALCLSLASVQGRKERAKSADDPVVRAQGGSRMRRLAPGHEAVHELAGRPLHVRGGGKKSVLLQRAGDKESTTIRRNSGGAKTPSVQQYLVRVAFPMPAGLTDYLHELAGGGFLRYLPYDTFAIAMDRTALEKASKASGVVDIYVFPPAMKIDPNLVKHMATASLGEEATSPTHHDEFLDLVGVTRRALPQSSALGGSELKRSSKKGAHVLYALLASHGGKEWELQAAGMAMEWQKAFSAMGIDASVEIASKQKAVVKVSGARALKKIVAWLVQEPLVHFLQEQKEISLRNKEANFAMQSWNATTHAIWARGILGTGQIVGVADTGIDFDNCFFRDKAMPTPPRCSGTGHVTTAGCINKAHRKIVTYRKFNASDYDDYYGGHGTHVVGSVAGFAVTDDASKLAFASEYNGAAPGAKIAFDDVGDAVGNLGGIPWDLSSGLFPHSYAAGARIHSNSWGSTATNYDMMAMEVDEFMHAHDDFLVLVAAGNDGPMSWSVGSPATAKNILSVGATENGGSASQTSVEMKISYSSSAADAQYEVTPASFGPPLQNISPLTKIMVVASPQDGCSAMQSMPGKIALIKRGTCNFDTKVLNAQNAGALAAVVFNNVDGANFVMGGADVASSVTIPSAFISWTQGTALQTATESGITVTIPVLTTLEGLSTAHHVIAGFSSRGPTDELRLKPDVLCPGVNIHSAHGDGNTGSNNCGIGVGTSDGAVATMSGTSMATPLCAGAAAMVREYFFKGFSSAGVADASKKIDPSSALVKAVMIHSAQPVKTESAGGYETDYPNMQTGYGRVELSSALEFEDSEFDAIYRDREVLSNGEHSVFCFNVGVGLPNQDFRVSIVWTDPPGDPSISRSLVNDLDLVVNGPNDAVFLGNTLKQTDESHGTYVVRDSVNNAEQVRVMNPVAGYYAVRVVGKDIPVGPQKFALVASSSSMAVATAAECSAVQCPNACSGRGSCLSSGICGCPMTHGGADCSMEYKVLQLVENATQTTALSVTWLGMSYYTFEIEEGGSFALSFAVGSQDDGSDADFYLSKDRIPTLVDYDGIIADAYSTGNFWSVGNAKGTWVLGLHAWKGDVSVLTALTAGNGDDMGGGDGGDGGGIIDEGGGSDGGSGTGTSNCTEPCKCGRFTTLSGALSDGSGSDDYSNDGSCWWIIAPDDRNSSHQLSLTFNAFLTEYYYDNVSIYECHDPWCQSVTWIEEISGVEVTFPYSVSSSTGIMLITFDSDQSITDSGFSAVWSTGAHTTPPDEGYGGGGGYGSGDWGSGGYGGGYGSGNGSYGEGYDGGVDGCTSPCECGFSTALSGTIEDGSGDESYPHMSRCRWVVGNGAVGTRVALWFPFFTTETGYDFVYINECESLSWIAADGTNLTAHGVPLCVAPRSVAIISGTVSPIVHYYALTGMMEVVFRSDVSVGAQGFEAQWLIDNEDEALRPHVCTAPCACGELTSQTGMLQDGSVEGKYASNADCTWTIVIPGANWVKLRFIKFDLEEKYDFVSVYQCAGTEDCSDSNAGTLLTRLSGPKVDHDAEGWVNGWIMAQGSMRVRFTSDSNINKHGFKAVWISSLNNTDPGEGEDDDSDSGYGDSWPYSPPADFQHCWLSGDWALLRPAAYDGNVRTGGLGLMSEPGHFDTWVCHYSHSCAQRLQGGAQFSGTGSGTAVGSGSISDMNPFCWVYNEILASFDPWGHASELGLL